VVARLDADVADYIDGLGGTENVTEMVNEALRNQYVNPESMSAAVTATLLRMALAARGFAETLEGLARGQIKGSSSSKRQ
jgi:hypothetical protein